MTHSRLDKLRLPTTPQPGQQPFACFLAFKNKALRRERACHATGGKASPQATLGMLQEAGEMLEKVGCSLINVVESVVYNYFRG